jgi:glycerol-3-phosphate dehydrogenase (NAD(P)+)
MNIAILGTGAFGKTLGKILVNTGNIVSHRSFRTWGDSQSVSDADLVISTLSASGLYSLGQDGFPFQISQDTPIISATKWLVPEEYCRPTAYWIRHFPYNPVFMLSGPNIASEMQLWLPTVAVIAGKDKTVYESFAHIFSTPTFFTIFSCDKIGTERCAILKNIVAIGIGMIDAYGLGNNAKGLFCSYALADIAQFIADHGDSDTRFMFWPAGIADLIATSTSHQSRNFRFGSFLASGLLAEHALEQVWASVEWYETSKIFLAILQQEQYQWKYLFLEAFCGLLCHNSFNKKRMIQLVLEKK